MFKFSENDRTLIHFVGALLQAQPQIDEYPVGEVAIIGQHHIDYEPIEDEPFVVYDLEGVFKGCGKTMPKALEILAAEEIKLKINAEAEVVYLQNQA